MKKRILYPIIYLALIAIVIFFAFGGIQNKSLTQKNITSSEFNKMLQNNEFQYVLIVNERDAYCITHENVNKVDFTKDTEKINSEIQKKYEYKASITYTEEFDKALSSAQEANPDSFRYSTEIVTPPWYIQYLPYIFLFIIVGITIYFFIAQSAGNGKAMQFGKSTAKLYDDSKKKVTFNDVAGADEEKEELAEIVGFLKNPDKYTKMGARIPKGVLLVGPPGTGKTLLAKSVAGEAGVPFFSITGSDFVELYVGIGAARVRDLFNQAKKNHPCIIFIDEIDAVGRRRGSGIGGGHDEREQTLNQLLVEMDGFVGNEGIIIIAATNRADILDPALLRSGRFDRQIHVLPPDTKGREDIFKIHARNKHFADDVSAHEIALLTAGFVGADIQNLCNEAALLAVRRNHEKITMQDLKDSITRVIMGPEKKSHKTTEKDRKLTAYHEAGHAIVAKVASNCDPVTEVSIIPRGGAGGYTLMRPDQEHNTYSRAHILDSIAMGLGGRAAEKLIFNEITTGASADIKHITELAKGYVTKYGMYDEIGPIFLGDTSSDEVFLGRDFASQKGHSEELCAKIDAAISDIIVSADKRALDILTEKRDILDNLAEVLLDMEKITGQQFDQIFEGKTLADFKAELNTETEPSEANTPSPTTEEQKSDETNTTEG